MKVIASLRSVQRKTEVRETEADFIFTVAHVDNWDYIQAKLLNFGCFDIKLAVSSNHQIGR